MEEHHHHHHQELHLLHHASSSSSSQYPQPSDPRFLNHFDGRHPSLDLQLSISVAPFKPPINSEKNNNCNIVIRKVRDNHQFGNNDINGSSVEGLEALKWQAAEQIKLAAMEKAYAERVMEMTRREMELAQSEFARARSLWERAREEVERAEMMRERAMREKASTCMEITCLSCRQKFRP